MAFDRYFAEFLLLEGAQAKHVLMEAGVGPMDWNICLKAGLGFEPVFEIAAGNPAALLKEMIGIIANGVGGRQQSRGMP